MSRTIFLNGQPIHLDPSQNVGAGGQATIVKHGDLALKLWHQLDPNAVRKIEFLLRQPLKLPDNILQPKTMITDRPDRGNTVGYAMPLLPKDFREIAVLFNRKLRPILQISLPTAVSLLDHAQQTLQLIHQAGLVLGDVSGRNIAFTTKPLKTFFYDIDSWVINGLPCPVWSEFFLDPLLANISPKPFTQLTDWYGFAVIAFWSIYSSHPYHGSHPTVADDQAKARQGLWLFNSQVTPPSFALPPEVIDDDLLDYFEKIFARQLRLPLPSRALNSLTDNLIQCPACDLWYVKTRKRCPGCSKVSPVAKITLVTLHPLITTTEPIIFAHYQQQTLFVISRSSTKLTLHIKGSSTLQQSLSLSYFPPSSRFDIIGDSHLAVSEPGSETINIYDFSSGNLRSLASTTSQIYAGNRQLAFKGTGSGLLRLVGYQLLRGSIRFDQLIETQLPVSTAPNQTWFWADPLSETILGLFRVFNRYQFWVIGPSGRFEVDIPQLPPGQTLIDLTVKFSSKSLLFRRLIQAHGLNQVETFVISLTGQVLGSFTRPLTDYPLDQIHGTAYDHGKAWYSTDQGLIVEDLFAGTFTLVNKTTKAVTAHDQLIHLGGQKHFLVIRDRSVDYLILP